MKATEVRGIGWQAILLIDNSYVEKNLVWLGCCIVVYSKYNCGRVTVVDFSH